MGWRFGGTAGRRPYRGWTLALLVPLWVLLLVVARGGRGGSPAAPPIRACAAGTSASQSSAQPLGRLLYTGTDGHIRSLDLSRGIARDMTPDLPPGAVAGDPAPAPDGGLLVFTLNTPAATGTAAGTDLYAMDSRGGPPYPLLLHEQPGVLIDAVTWAGDSRAIAYAYSAPILAPDDHVTGARREIQRLDLATGARVPLVAGGASPTFAGGGMAALAYLRPDPSTGDVALWVAGPDGQDPVPIVTRASGLALLDAPRFSPDGRYLVLAAQGAVDAGELAPTPSRPPPGALHRLLGAVGPGLAAAHEAPKGLWEVARDGTGLCRLIPSREDGPRPAWSPSGVQIAFLSGEGLFVMDRDGRNLRRLSGEGNHGGLAWAAP